MIAALTVAHIAVLGYWLGAELIINSTYRYACYRDDLTAGVRIGIVDHVMTADQHVRYALALQLILGVMLAAVFGYVPGGNMTLTGAAIAGVLWLAFIEVVHRRRKMPSGILLARADRVSRYLLLVTLLLLSAGLIGSNWNLPFWLRVKLALFAAIIACGVGIRLTLIPQFVAWEQLRESDGDRALNAEIRSSYRQATGILIALWVFIAGIVVLSISRPWVS